MKLRLAMVALLVAAGAAGCHGMGSTPEGTGAGAGGSSSTSSAAGGGQSAGGGGAPETGGSGGASAPSAAGFAILEYAPGLKAALWYPTYEMPEDFEYVGQSVGVVAPDAAPAAGPFPFVVFSHGDDGCGIQSIFLTEELARRGYVVAAPDHLDALCSVDGNGSRGPYPYPVPSFGAPYEWTSATHADRGDDIAFLVDYLLAHPTYASAIDADRMGLVGHSLGGYTALGLLGGWSDWEDARYKAGLLLSPYTNPYLVQDSLPVVDVPLMYQSGTADVGVKPFLLGPNGAYTDSNPPKYYAELEDKAHFAWTNTECAAYASIAECLATDDAASLIVAYGAAFLDEHLKGIAAPILTSQGDGLAAYQFDVGP